MWLFFEKVQGYDQVCPFVFEKFLLFVKEIEGSKTKKRTKKERIEKEGRCSG